MISRAVLARSSVSFSIMYDPPQGSITLGMPLSSRRMSCVLRATRAEVTVGRPTASSYAFVCKLWVPPKTAAIASTVVLHKREREREKR
jgi:hypothetical protein